MARTNNTSAQRKRLPWQRWLNYFLQALWVAGAIYIVQLYVLSVRPGYAELTTVCTEPICPDTQMSEVGLASITRLGISLHTFAVVRLFLVYAITVVYGTVSLLIFRAKRLDNVALYVALVLLFYGAFLSDYVDVLRGVQPQFGDLVDILPGVTLIAFMILCFVFPDGRFFPRWTVWAAWGWIIAPLILIVATVFDAFDAAAGPVGVVLLILLATCVIAPIQRYRRLSSRTQRQQLKWVLFGLAQLLATQLILVELLPMIFPQLDVAGALPNILSNLFQSFTLILFPITVGIAMLRYRLWNVNMVINRTLVYVPLTSILTVIYTTSMAVSQRLFATATGEAPQAVAIFTTIVLTTTFTPIKHALQSYVDRNFKEAPEKLKELESLGEEVAQVVRAFDYQTLAQRVVEMIVQAHHAEGAALYLRAEPLREASAALAPTSVSPLSVPPLTVLEQTSAAEVNTAGAEMRVHEFEDVFGVVPLGVAAAKMQLAYATPTWTGVANEVSILLVENGVVMGRLHLGQPRDREDYALDEVEDIRAAALPVVANMVKLRLLQAGMVATAVMEDEVVLSGHAEVAADAAHPATESQQAHARGKAEQAGVIRHVLVHGSGEEGSGVSGELEQVGD